jgi:hypothetical protein
MEFESIIIIPNYISIKKKKKIYNNFNSNILYLTIIYILHSKDDYSYY